MEQLREEVEEREDGKGGKDLGEKLKEEEKGHLGKMEKGRGGKEGKAKL